MFILLVAGAIFLKATSWLIANQCQFKSEIIFTSKKFPCIQSRCRQRLVKRYKQWWRQIDVWDNEIQFSISNHHHIRARQHWYDRKKKTEESKMKTNEDLWCDETWALVYHARWKWNFKWKIEIESSPNKSKCKFLEGIMRKRAWCRFRNSDIAKRKSSQEDCKRFLTPKFFPSFCCQKLFITFPCFLLPFLVRKKDQHDNCVIILQ